MTISEAFSELILFNGSVAADLPGQPAAQAVAVGQGRILAVGANDDVLQLAGAGTEKINLNGRLVVPGFIDTHIHFYEWALKRKDLKLDDLTCLEGLIKRIENEALQTEPGRWIIGQGWNETDWTAPRMPTREVLDMAAPDHPVLLWRCDMHLAAANSAALKLAGIDRRTPDPPRGRIERDPTGNPTGIVRELAINRIREVIGPPTGNALLEAFEDAAGALNRRGITGIHDIRLMGDTDGARALSTFQRLDQENRLALRCWVALPGNKLDDIIGLGLRTGFGNDRLRIGHVKFFSDGGMGARTAWLIDPYLDADSGMPLMDMTDLAREIEKADRAGLSVMVHAVGDRANRELVAIFEALENHRARSGWTAPHIPHRIEHVQMIRPDDADRLAKLNLALCVTPANMILDINLIDSAVEEKGEWAYAFRRLMDTGAPVMFSSDCPVCVPDPLMGIYAAVARQRIDGTPNGGWYPDSRITVAEALNAYTSTPALVHKQTHLGTIEISKRADLAILSDNVLTRPAALIPRTKVDMTLFDGRIVYRRF